MGANRPDGSCHSRAQHAVPPHDRSSYKHQRRSQSKDRPNCFGRLVAEPGAAARNTDAINAAEMQEGEPVNDAVDDAEPSISGSRRLQPVGQLLNLLGESEIDAADPENDRKREAPEADCTVQVP